MPNYCINALEVTGPKEILANFIEAAKSKSQSHPTPISLQSLYPCPTDLRDVEAGSGEGIYHALYGDPEKAYHIVGETREERILSAMKYHRVSSRNEVIARADMYKRNMENHGALTWYDWSIDHWGTKWDVGHVAQGGEDEAPEYTFESAWSPPAEAFTKISKDFKALTFLLKYYEEGCDFVGIVKFKNGNAWTIDEASISELSDKAREHRFPFLPERDEYDEEE